MKLVLSFNRFWLRGLLLAAGLMVVMLLMPVQAVDAQAPGCIPGPHSGTIAADETWCLADSPHMVTDYLTINPGVTVTVEAGVVVKNAQRISVNGSLVAVGTAAQPIVFTSTEDSAPMQWRGLVFEGADASGDLRNVIVRYAGYTAGNAQGYMIYVNGLASHSLRLEDSLITDGYEPAGINSLFTGLFIANSNAIIKNNHFSNLGNSEGAFLDAPFVIEGNILNLDISGNTLINNNRDSIVFSNHYAQPAPVVTGVMTLVKGQPWVLESDLTVAPGATLTFEPGAVLMGGTKTEIRTRGHLEAVGTPEEPIVFRSVAGTGMDQWSGLTFVGGTGNLSYIRLQNGGGANDVSVPAYSGYYNDYQTCVNPAVTIRDVINGEVRIEHSVIENNGNYYWWRADGIMSIHNSHVVLIDNHFANNGAPVQRNDYYIPENNFGIFAYGPETVLTMTSNIFNNNLGWNMLGEGQFTLEGNVFRNQPSGVKFNPNVGAAISNTVFADLDKQALLLGNNVTLDAQHLTFARNGGTAITVNTGANLTLANSIVAENPTGISIASSGSATMNYTLWDRNATNKSGSGSLVETASFTGAAGFGADGYHLSRYSSALQKGGQTELDFDIDGEERPAPAGTLPDLGADEYSSLAVSRLEAEKFAGIPKGVLTIDPFSGDLSFKVMLDYWIRFFHGSEAPEPLDLTITDTLATELTLESQTNSPEMSFAQTGQTLTWQSLGPIAVDQSAEVMLRTYGYPQPGTTLVNQATVQAGSAQFDLTVQTIVPQYPPLITSPGNGKYCYSDGAVHVEGYAWASSAVRLFENGEEKATATSGANGKFAFDYTTGTPNQALTLTAQVCKDSSYAQCSENSAPVTITPSESFWCPQRSSWSKAQTTYRFRDASGAFSTQTWLINGYYGFWDTQLKIHACNCPVGSGTTLPPTNIWVVADGITYGSTGSHPDYTFNITGGAHNVEFWAQCGENRVSSTGSILIDPDGYVFDSTLGFDSDQPTAHSLQGVTVTAYVWMPEWGGWTMWPAQLYDNQVNPQVTGADGYFAFYTPPGKYYLQVNGIDGYQSWRSGVIEVTNQLVHVNVPLSPNKVMDQQVLLTAYGPVQPVVSIKLGQTVEWRYLVDESSGAGEFMKEIENPLSRLVSSLDPLADVLGFDSGMLIPDQTYRRQFNELGTYTYSDGRGHTGIIHVQELFQVFLPLLMR